MSLPPDLVFGTHRLKLLAVSRNADDVLDARRCSDHALTAFCFVGEMNDAATEPAIAWYYSPLYQFERKKIRVEESVIAAALTKAVTEQCSSGVGAAAVQNRSIFMDATSSPDVPLLGGADEDEKAPAREGGGRRSSLPALFIRLGKSTTFREYKLVLPEPFDATPAQKVGDEATEPNTKAGSRHVTPPVLSPVLPPRKPSLRSPGFRFGSFSVRRPPLKREGLNNFVTAIATSSAPNHIEDPSTAGADALLRYRSSPTMSHTNLGDEGATGNEMVAADDDTHSVTSTTTAPVVFQPPHSTSNVLAEVRPETSPLWSNCTASALKGTLNGGAGSSLSSAFLSTSNVLSGRVSRLPTSTMSTARSPGVESDMRPSSSHGPGCASTRCSRDAPLLMREPLLFSSAVFSADALTPSVPTPPSSQHPRTPRRPLMRSLAGRAHSDHSGHSCNAADGQREADNARASTPPATHVR
jgi:hypothetical protein